MKRFIFVASLISTSAGAEPAAVVTLEGPEATQLYQQMNVRIKPVEYCGPYSDNCPTFPGKTINNSKLFIECYKDLPVCKIVVHK